MVMNVLGLSLLLTSLAAAAIFSPNPHANTNTNTREEKQGASSTIVKEGHRVVVVEYDQDGLHNTKISISPPESSKDRMAEAASSVLPNLGQGISQDYLHTSKDIPQDMLNFLHAPNPKELICDAYGKCKHKIADAMEKTKERAQEALHKNKEAARHVGDAVGKAKDTAFDKARDVHHYTKDTAQTVKEHVEHNVSDAMDDLESSLKETSWKPSFEWIKGQLNSLMGVANLLGFATAYGMCVWITFISSYVLSRAMPRQQFAVVQSKIYPVYFRAMTYSIAISLLGHLFAHSNKLVLLSSNPHSIQTYNLLASLFTLLLNSLYLEPRATKLMFERIKIEKEEGRGREDMSGERGRSGEADPSSTTTQRTYHDDAVRSRIMKLNDKLKKLNSYSSILNILNLMSLTWHLVYLAQRAHHTC